MGANVNIAGSGGADCRIGRNAAKFKPAGAGHADLQIFRAAIGNINVAATVNGRARLAIDAGERNVARAINAQLCAAIDGASPMKRFWTIVFPLLSPTTFFLMVVNVVYAMFDTFGIIHATTQGGPAQATNTLVYKVYADGFVGLNLGSSAAQSVILMVIVVALTVVQFRFIERRVNY